MQRAQRNTIRMIIKAEGTKYILIESQNACDQELRVGWQGNQIQAEEQIHL